MDPEFQTCGGRSSIRVRDWWRRHDSFPGTRSLVCEPAYREVLRLPADALLYYATYARENFVNYRDLSVDNDLAVLLRCAHAHSAWVLSKYSIDEGAAGRLKEHYSRHGGH